jgi:hypothetical protein
MARKGLPNQIWTTDIDNVLRGLRRQGRLLQLITVCKKAKKLWIKGMRRSVCSLPEGKRNWYKRTAEKGSNL